MMKVSFIDYNEIEPLLPDIVSGSERKNYAMPGKTCDRLVVKANSLNYSMVSIEGADQVTEFLDAIKDGILEELLLIWRCVPAPVLTARLCMVQIRICSLLSTEALRKHVDHRKKTMGGEMTATSI